MTRTTLIKVASYQGGGQIGKLVGPNDYTILYGLTNERAQIRSRDPRDSTTWSATQTLN